MSSGMIVGIAMLCRERTVCFWAVYAEVHFGFGMCIGCGRNGGTDVLHDVFIGAMGTVPSSGSMICALVVSPDVTSVLWE